MPMRSAFCQPDAMRRKIRPSQTVLSIQRGKIWRTNGGFERNADPARRRRRDLRGRKQFTARRPSSASRRERDQPGITRVAFADQCASSSAVLPWCRPLNVLNDRYRFCEIPIRSRRSLLKISMVPCLAVDINRHQFLRSVKDRPCACSIRYGAIGLSASRSRTIDV